MYRLISIVLGLAFFLPACAEKSEEFAKADTFDLFLVTAQTIRKDMENGGKFEFITPSDKLAASGDLDAMTALLKKSRSVSTMNMQDKLTLFNLQEHLNGILTHSDSERLICTRGENTGSHIQKTSCKTYGDIQREKLALKAATDQRLRDTPQGNLEPCLHPSMCGH